jgi:hypothetical protein
MCGSFLKKRGWGSHELGMNLFSFKKSDFYRMVQDIDDLWYRYEQLPLIAREGIHQILPVLKI